MYISIAMWKFRYLYGQYACMFESIMLLYSKNVFCNMLKNDFCFHTLLCIWFVECTLVCMHKCCSGIMTHKVQTACIAALSVNIMLRLQGGVARLKKITGLCMMRHYVPSWGGCLWVVSLSRHLRNLTKLDFNIVHFVVIFY